LLILVAALLALPGCGSFTLGAPTPLPTVVLGGAGPSPAGTALAGQTERSVVATASGVVAPSRTTQLAATANAGVRTLDAAVGDKVKAGQVLVRLSGSEKLAASLEAANLELLTARQAEKTLKDESSQKLAAARLRLANANKALDDAQKRRDSRRYQHGSQSQIEAAQAKVILANNEVKNAQESFSYLAAISGDDDVNKAAALSDLAAKRLNRDKAVAELNYLLALPSQIEVDQAEAALNSARSEHEAASREVESLKNGPDPDALALNAQRIKNAEAQAASARAALEDLTLKAPFDGTVSRVNVHAGEWVVVGQVLLTLADLARLRVETTDLSERSVPQVQPGGRASVLVKALGQRVSGRVVEIAPLADTLGGDVVYKTTIELDNQPEGLRSGMSVDVQFEGK
jgi:HlyD family secretion protein